MDALLSLGLAAVFPLVCLAMVLWLSHLEDTLPQAVRRAARAPEPAPILRIPVRRRPLPAPVLHLPEQRVPEHVVPQPALTRQPAPAQPAGPVPVTALPHEPGALTGPGPLTEPGPLTGPGTAVAAPATD